jgi:transcription elongation factor Elf1
VDTKTQIDYLEGQLRPANRPPEKRTVNWTCSHCKEPQSIDLSKDASNMTIIVECENCLGDTSVEVGNA